MVRTAGPPIYVKVLIYIKTLDFTYKKDFNN